MEVINNDNLTLIDPDSNHFDMNINFKSYSTSSFITKDDIDPYSHKLYNNACSLMTDNGAKKELYEGFLN